jgi:glycosyltransferase involved in cell wall biosynthesis
VPSPLNGKITVAVPAHPARLMNGMLARALTSIAVQLLPPAAISVAVDTERQGAAPTRQRALDAVRTEWVAFLDSDDWFDPDHLAVLAAGAAEHEADYVYSYWHGPDILGHFGEVFDPAKPIETTMTILVRTELAKQVGFARLEDRLENSGEDWRMTTGCAALGAKIVHIPRRTWTYNMHGGNTSGLPFKGDAR